MIDKAKTKTKTKPKKTQKSSAKAAAKPAAKRPAKSTRPAVAVSQELEELSLAFAERAKAGGGFQHELAASLLALASMVMADDAATVVERMRGGRLGFALEEAKAIIEGDRRRTKTLAGIPVAAVKAAAEEMRKERVAEDLTRALRERLALALQLAPPKDAAEIARVLAALITSERAQPLFPDLEGREYAASTKHLTHAIDRVLRARRVRKIAKLADEAKETLAAAIITEAVRASSGKRSAPAPKPRPPRRR